MESADRESRRLDILSVKKEANLSARMVYMHVKQSGNTDGRRGNCSKSEIAVT